MNVQGTLGKIKIIQSNLLDFLEEKDDTDENFQKYKQILEKQKIQEECHDLKLFLQLLKSISNNHFRGPDLFNKIFRILNFLKGNIMKLFKNHEIFKIFKSNKRILLFLIEESIIKIDKKIVEVITAKKYLQQNYHQYFSPEIQQFKNEEWFPNNKWTDELNKELPEDFDEKRKIGENDDFLCKLIQKDLIVDFISYINRINLQLESYINLSIYETNSLLLKENETSLIEYAAFFGSTQIFQYLRMNGVQMRNSLWLYSIHGQNAEIINLLEENDVKPIFNSYRRCFEESIKCHHNEIANYFYYSYLNTDNHDEDEEQINNTCVEILKNYNFNFISNESINKSLFGQLCRYDYYALVDFLLKNEDIDVNEKIIFNIKI